MGDLGVELSEMKWARLGKTPIGREIWVRSPSGIRTRLDSLFGVDDAGNYMAVESKFSFYNNYNLSYNQRIAIEEINRLGYAFPFGIRAEEAGLKPGSQIFLHINVQKW
jgi:hypothetical protein